MAAQPGEIVEAGGDRVDPRIDKGIGFGQAFGAREHVGIAAMHRRAHGFDRMTPAIGAVIGDEAGIDAGLARFLMLQQQVGHAGIGRHDEDAVIEVRALASRDQDIVEQGRSGGHGGAADLFHAMLAAHASASSIRGPVTGAIGCGSPRAAMNSGRGLSTPNGAARRLLRAL